MLIQIIFLLILCTIAGAVVFIAKLTDPNFTPSSSRERIYPFGYALLFAGISGLGLLFVISYIGTFLPSDSVFISMTLLAGYGLSILAAAILGYKVGQPKK
jgi:hypothetical protein